VFSVINSKVVAKVFSHAKTNLELMHGLIINVIEKIIIMIMVKKR